RGWQVSSPWILRQGPGFDPYLNVGDHARDAAPVGSADQGLLIERALALARLGGQDVARAGVAAHDLARSSGMKTLGRSAMAFQLGHGEPVSSLLFRGQDRGEGIALHARPELDG